MPQQDRHEALRRELDADQLIKNAQEKAGLSDFGSMKFYPSLCKFLACAIHDIAFHEQGMGLFIADVERFLINRLRMQDDLKKHPEILEEDVSDPIIVIGLARSGTTKLQKMLSAPDNVHKVYFWRTWNPSRFPNAVPGKPDPRIAAADFSQLNSADNPIIDAAHHMESQEVEEEWILYMHTFEEWALTQTLPIPSFFDWVMPRPSIGSFRHVKVMMQYLQWQDGGKRDQPWIMKSVGYIANLDSLLECYPDATLVHAHRDPRDTIPSFAKFLSGVWSLYAENVDPHFVGAETQRTWQIAVERYLEARDRLKLDERILDVGYDQIRSDPMSIIRKIYARSPHRLTAEAEQKMADWHNTNEQGRYGKHEYTLKELGLSDDGIDKAFAAYIHRFIQR